jgi:hypothetical protein
VLLLVRHESELRIANLGLLDDVLPGSTSYFALAPTPLREWFDPAVQVYLARIVAQRLVDPEFRHHRVLLFFSKEQLLDAHASYQDEYYARALIRLHDQFEAKLGFMPPDELFELLETLPVEERLALGCYAPLIRWLPLRVLAKVRLSWSSRLIHTLAFAKVTDRHEKQRVIVFAKHATVLEVNSLDDAEKAKPYLNLIKLVQERIYNPGTEELKNEYRFAAHMSV